MRKILPFLLSFAAIACAQSALADAIRPGIIYKRCAIMRFGPDRQASAIEYKFHCRDGFVVVSYWTTTNGEWPDTEGRPQGTITTRIPCPGRDDPSVVYSGDEFFPNATTPEGQVPSGGTGNTGSTAGNALWQAVCGSSPSWIPTNTTATWPGQAAPATRTPSPSPSSTPSTSPGGTVTPVPVTPAPSTAPAVDRREVLHCTITGVGTRTINCVRPPNPNGVLEVVTVEGGIRSTVLTGIPCNTPRPAGVRRAMCGGTADGFSWDPQEGTTTLPGQ